MKEEARKQKKKKKEKVDEEEKGDGVIIYIVTLATLFFSIIRIDIRKNNCAELKELTKEWWCIQEKEKKQIQRKIQWMKQKKCKY